jgi:peptidoglycan/LPS O-acetylase OafA/YrhL
LILLWGGEAMVNLFFVMSGYVLSYRPLSMLYASEYPKMYEGIASAVFRRAFRLWLPTMAAILLIAFLTQMRAFEPARHVYNHLNKVQVRAFQARTNVTRLIEQGLISESPVTHLVREKPPPMANSTLEQGLHAIKQCWLLVKTSAVGDVAKHDMFAYDAHAWTIAVEFKSSITLFTLAMATSMFTSGWRLFLHGAVLLYCALEGYRTSLFVAGMIIAELDLIRKHSEKRPLHLGALLGNPWPAFNASHSARRFDPSSAAWGLCFVVGLYILSIPFMEPVTASPYVYLAELLPAYVSEKNKLIRSIGAVMTTWSCVHSGTLAPVLNSSLAQYLGKISFSLYLTHGLLIRSVGYVVLWWLRAYTGAYVREETTLGQFVFIWLCGYIVMLPIFLWTADLFWRSIDVPSVRLARRLEQRFKRPQDGKSRDEGTTGFK